MTDPNRGSPARDSGRAGILRYLLAASLVATGLLIQMIFRDLIGGKTFLLLYPFLFTACVTCGFGPGLLASGLAALGAWYYFMPVINSFTLKTDSDLFGILIFSAMGLSFSVFGHLLRAARFRAAELLEQVRGTMQAAEAAEAKLHGLLENAQDAILIVGPGGQIEFVNEQISKWFGYAREELIGKSIELLVPMASRAAHVRQREEFTREASRRPMGKPGYDLKGLRKDGSEFPIEVALSTAETPQGRVVIAILRDISEIQARNAENARLYRESQLALRGREEVLAFVSHDLRSPLTAISLATQLLARLDVEDYGRIPDLTAQIQRSVNQMQKMIGDLLDFAKFRGGAFSIERRPEHFAGVLAPVLEMLEGPAGARGLRFETDLPGELPAAVCDKSRVGQVLANLLGNAVKFSSPGGVIRVAAREADGDLHVSVSDSGPGIPPEILPRIFERFWQAKGTRDLGTGLGLSIAKGIVEAYGGRIWAESQVGKGTTFHFTLPGEIARRKAAVG